MKRLTFFVLLTSYIFTNLGNNDTSGINLREQTSMMTTSLQIEKMKHAFTNLRADNLHILDDFYAADAHFLDPLGEHRGLESIKAYYQGLYQNVTSIEFDYRDIISQGNQHALVWIMKLKAQGLNGGDLVETHGTSIIKFNDQNLVIYHRDYFDMHEFIYRYVPVIGWLTKQVNQRLKK